MLEAFLLSKCRTKCVLFVRNSWVSALPGKCLCLYSWGRDHRGAKPAHFQQRCSGWQAVSGILMTQLLQCTMQSSGKGQIWFIYIYINTFTQLFNHTHTQTKNTHVVITDGWRLNVWYSHKTVTSAKSSPNKTISKLKGELPHDWVWILLQYTAAIPDKVSIALTSYH